MQGAVVDVSFAHIMDDVVIGCVDELGNLFVYRVTENSTGLIQVGNIGLKDTKVKGLHLLRSNVIYAFFSFKMMKQIKRNLIFRKECWRF